MHLIDDVPRIGDDIKICVSSYEKVRDNVGVSDTNGAAKNFSGEGGFENALVAIVVRVAQDGAQGNDSQGC